MSLGGLGCRTVHAATADEGLDYAASARVDVVVVDVSEGDAFESPLVRELREMQPHLRVLYLIGRANPVFRRGPGPIHESFLRKPFRVYDLGTVVFSWFDEDMAMLAAAGISMN